jgi:hypothetical protein
MTDDDERLETPDRWIETLKNDVGDDASAIVARLE